MQLLQLTVQLVLPQRVGGVAVEVVEHAALTRFVVAAPP
jgi:hypothetical protein